MLNLTSFERQEINLVFKIKVFVGSKIWYFDKSIYLYFPKIWVVTNSDTASHDVMDDTVCTRVPLRILRWCPDSDGTGHEKPAA
jgi:hypothetical protein